MNKNLVFHIFVAVLLVTTSIASASSSKSFDEILQPYEAIRLTLLQDSTEDIAERATAIRDIAETASQDVKVDEEIQPLLTKVAGFAIDLSEAKDLETTRTAFYEMSKILVRYRARLEGSELPTVIYCPMAKKSWLQLAEEIGNPYHGQAMASCGQDVSN